MSEEFERLYQQAIHAEQAQQTPQAVRALVNDLAANSPSYILQLLEGSGQTPRPRHARRNLMVDFSGSTPSADLPDQQFEQLFQKSCN